MRQILEPWRALALAVAMVAAASAQTVASPSLRALLAGDPARAAALARAAIEAQPNEAAGFVDLAQAYMATGRFEEAYRELRRALALQPDDADALFQMAKVGLILSEVEYSRLLSESPDFYRAHQLAAESAVGRGDFEAARQHYVRGLEAEPDSVTLLTAMGDLVRTRGDLVEVEEQEPFGAALAYYERALALDPDNHDANYGAAVCWYRRGDNKSALEGFERAAAIEPDSAIALLGVGVIRVANRDHEAAIAAFERAIAAEPDMKQAYVLLSRSYRAVGRSEDSRRILETLRSRRFQADESNDLLGAGGLR